MLLKKISALLTCLVILLPLGGCWDMAELNERTFALGIGIDISEEPGTHIYTFQTSRFDSGSEYINISFSEESLAKAVRELEISCGTVSFEHLSAVILGEETAMTRFVPSLDWLFREGLVRRQSKIAVAAGTARAILDKKCSGGSAKYISGLLEKNDSPKMLTGSASLSDIYIANTNMQGFCLPLISASDSESVSSSDCIMSTDGMFCYTQSGFSGRLNDDEAELCRIFSGRQADGIIESADANGSITRYRINSSRSKKEAFIEDGKLIYNISLDLDCSAIESISESDNFSSQIEKSLSEKLMSVAERSRTVLGAAPLGLDTVTRRYLHKWYTQNRTVFDEYYSESRILVEINCTVRRAGSLE